ncbi:6514_t:CDS:1 [Ambispora gerdemannii]|uniref:Post-GPI attachment to proteins factor 3 n=1 Tax=Ambispora gerdemannii TaxID=144530 RepID=A0A9N9BUL2_9GLOM|nr:6514_t:CDS:1 [Ambispora gerdemannii]
MQSPFKRSRLTNLAQHNNTYTLLSTIIFFVIFYICVPTAVASRGDHASEFQECVEKCRQSSCSSNTLLPFILRLFMWSCEDECKYECMHEIHSKALNSNQEIVQYYGKWPFHRLWGMQEPASVLFSFLNGYTHYRYLSIIRRTIPDTYYMKKFYIGYAYACINSWFWSAIYHSRDFPHTEKLDYFSAAFSILFSFLFTSIRIFHIRSRRIIFVLATLCLLAFLAHISYLTFVTFDYGYNIVANGAVGFAHNFIWVWWSWKNWHSRPDAWRPFAAVIYVAIAMCLEIFDFPPVWGVLDAHALWHASTIPLNGFWYEFLIGDASIESLSVKRH